MATTLPVDKYVGRLPVNYTQPRPNQFFRDVINRLRLRVTDDNVILGYTDVTHATTPPPGFNMGPFYGRPLFDSAKWQFWSDPIGRYTWELHQVRDTSGFTVTLAAPGLTLPFYEQNLEDASGDVAMLTDIYVPRETIFFDSTSGAVTIDATTSYDFYGKLNANTAFTVSMPGNSMHVTVGVANIGTQFTATWTPAIKWEGGGEPTQPIAADPNSSGIAIYTFQKITGTIYGWMEDQTPGVPAPKAQPGGNPPNNYGGTGNTNFRGTNQFKYLP